MTILDLLLLLVFNTLVIVGVYVSTASDMIFGTPAEYAEAVLPEWAVKPLWSCPTCMSSFHGSLVWWLVAEHENEFVWILPRAFVLWPFYIFALAGLSRLVSHFIIPPEDKK